MIDTEVIKQKAEDNIQVIVDAANDLIMPRPIIEPEKRWLWLTFANCGFAVEVLRQQFEKEGIDAYALINRGVSGKRFQDHVLLAVDGMDETIYVDPTYLQFFSEFGLDASVVARSWENNGGDVLPDERSLVYTQATLEGTISWFSNQTISLLEQYQDTIPNVTEDLKKEHSIIPSHNMVEEFFNRIYNPVHLEPFSQIPEKQQLIIEYLEDYQPGRISIDALFRHYKYRLGQQTQ